MGEPKFAYSLRIRFDYDNRKDDNFPCHADSTIAGDSMSRAEMQELQHALEKRFGKENVSVVHIGIDIYANKDRTAGDRNFVKSVKDFLSSYFNISKVSGLK